MVLLNFVQYIAKQLCRTSERVINISKSIVKSVDCFLVQALFCVRLSMFYRIVDAQFISMEREDLRIRMAGILNLLQRGNTVVKRSILVTNSP